VRLVPEVPAVPDDAAGLRAADARLWEMVTQRDAEIAVLREQRSGLQSQVADLAARVASNSRNSSMPPSPDGLAKPAPKPLRGKSGRKPGRPKGRPGGYAAAQRASGQDCAVPAGAVRLLREVPHARTVLPVSRATSTPTRPDSPDSDSGGDMPGQSACPVTLSLFAQCSVTQQPATGASRAGACTPSALMMGITSAGLSPSARAISFGVRPLLRSSETRSTSSLLNVDPYSVRAGRRSPQPAVTHRYCRILVPRRMQKLYLRRLPCYVLLVRKTGQPASVRHREVSGVSRWPTR
jgi:hypothetical protein